MGSGHRHGHRARGPGGDGPPPTSERVLVLPGEEIPAHGLRPGPGTYRVQGRIYASVLGLLQTRPPAVRVVPLSGRYIPKPHDVVLGTVTDVQGTFWLLDIGAPRWAPLHMTGTHWKIDFGETAQYLRVGDAVVVAIEAIENTGRIGVTMLGEGLGKLEGGTIVEIAPARVPRVIGRGGSMIQTLTKSTSCRIVVGQNGRIYLEGPPEGLLRVRECLRMIDEEGHLPGLTERIQRYLDETRDPGQIRDHRHHERVELPHGPGDRGAPDLPTPPPLDVQDPAARAPAEESEPDAPDY